MALLEILSFKKKSQDILQKFKKSINNTLSLTNIPQNLTIIYDYISYEQSKSDQVCTEYFINNEIPSSLLLINNEEIVTFLIKVISVLNKENLKKFPFIPHSKLALIYSERLVVYNLEVDSVYIRYLADNFHTDKYYRYATILLFNLKEALSKFHKSRLVNKIILLFNESGDPEIFGMYMIYLLKEKERRRVVYSLPNYVSEKSEKCDKSENCNAQVNKNVEGNAKVNKSEGNAQVNKNVEGNVKVEEDTIDFKYLHSTKKSLLPPLNLHNKTTQFYKAILSKNILEEITDTIVEEFTKIFKNTEEDLDFLKTLIKEHPEALLKHMRSESGTYQWNVIEVYNILTSQSKYEEFKEDEEEVNTFLDKILFLQVKDKEVYYFVLKVNKEAFFSKIKKINKLVGDDEFKKRVCENFTGECTI